MTEARIHDDTVCLLGEGALWHPERGELLWFDILGRIFHTPEQRFRLPDLSSAAGWIDRDTVLMARRGALLRFDLRTGAEERVAGLAENDPGVRSNDGRADPWGGFWIGTMGLRAEKGAGAIWRWHGGRVHMVVPAVTIPNAICFSGAGYACWADTAEQVVWRQPLADADGFPVGEPSVHLDFRGTDLHPDGAVFDAAGNIWIAFWGAGKVAGFGPDGQQVAEFQVPAKQSTCPAWGGPDYSTLFVTTAAADIPQEELALSPDTGRTFAVDTHFRGLPEHRVIL
jgi:sugar lactone lactonase YvrE